MIHLFGDYYIKGNPLDYSLVKKSSRTDKNGNPVYTVLGYYGSVANACEGLRKTLSRELVAENDLTLSEAVTAFKQIAEKMEEATEGLK